MTKADTQAWQPIETAPHDGTMIWLAVDYTAGSCALVDVARCAATIGFNNLDNTDIDEWQFVGWSWNQDCFHDHTYAKEQPANEQSGVPVGWRPIGFDLDLDAFAMERERLMRGTIG